MGILCANGPAGFLLMSRMLLLVPGTSWRTGNLGVESTKAKKAFGNSVSEKARGGSNCAPCGAMLQAKTSHWG